jgi:membrane protease YdiL (CAAX protease family)
VGIITAILFAFMHDYGPLMVAPLIALGFMFSFMREWRGSIIAPVTAHFMHNFSLMSFMIILVQLIKDPVG